MPKDGYVQLYQQFGERRGDSGIRSLARVTGSEGLCLDDSAEYGETACCVPEGKVTTTNWQWVGKGNGSYVQENKYAFVGEGAGNYDPEIKTIYAGPCSKCSGSWCCGCFGVALVACLAYSSGAFSPDTAGLISGANDVGAAKQLAPASTTHLEPRYHCGLHDPGTYADGFAGAPASSEGLGPGLVSDAAEEASAISMWSAAKRVWCCQHASVGCVTTVAPQLPGAATHPYDCEAGLDNWEKGWSYAKRHWCCQHAGLGCQPSAPLPYDCDAEAEKWRTGWSEGKKLWCCREFGRGCAGAADVPFPAARDWYDCSAGYSKWKETWSISQQEWCCQHRRRGCREPTSAAEAPAVCRLDGASPKETPAKTRQWCCEHYSMLCQKEQPYDCESGWGKQQWSEGKSAWCCLHHGKACPHEAPYDCKVGARNQVVQWGMEKKLWCCLHTGEGCMMAPTPPSAFDCSVRSNNLEQHWAEEKRQWCCKHYERGCAFYTCAGDRSAWSEKEEAWCCQQGGANCSSPRPGTLKANSPFDCEAGLSNWKKGWSSQKMLFCCHHTGLGCSGLGVTSTTMLHAPISTTLGYDCQLGVANWQHSWSDAKKDWCCHRTGHHCAPKTTLAPYDCKAGLSHSENAWSDEKKVWCCKHEKRGCAAHAPASHYCSGEETSWSDARKIYCCQHGGRGCEKGTPVVLSCRLNCFGDGAKAVRLEGSVGEGDGAAIRGITMEECRHRCTNTSGCDGVLYTESQAPELGLSMCYGKKHFRMSKCQPPETGTVTEVLNTMPWGQCAVVGDPHILTWDRIWKPALVQTDPGDFWLVKSDSLDIMGRFGFTDRFPNASSATGLAVTGSLIDHHKLIVEYVGPTKGYQGFHVSWDGSRILSTFPSSHSSEDGVLRARHGYMDPSEFHREGRHTIGGTSGDLPSYLFEFSKDLRIYVLAGPDNCNIVIDARKVASGQDGYCGNFNCIGEDDSVTALRSRGLASAVPLADGLFTDAPRAPRATGSVPTHGGPAQDASPGP